MPSNSNTANKRSETKRKEIGDKSHISCTMFTVDMEEPPELIQAHAIEVSESPNRLFNSMETDMYNFTNDSLQKIEETIL